jgi:hypothetical protein
MFWKSSGKKQESMEGEESQDNIRIIVLLWRLEFNIEP